MVNFLCQNFADKRKISSKAKYTTETTLWVHPQKHYTECDLCFVYATLANLNGFGDRLRNVFVDRPMSLFTSTVLNNVSNELWSDNHCLYVRCDIINPDSESEQLLTVLLVLISLLVIGFCSYLLKQFYDASSHILYQKSVKLRRPFHLIISYSLILLSLIIETISLFYLYWIPVSPPRNDLDYGINVWTFNDGSPIYFDKLTDLISHYIFWALFLSFIHLKLYSLIMQIYECNHNKSYSSSNPSKNSFLSTKCGYIIVIFWVSIIIMIMIIIRIPNENNKNASNYEQIPLWFIGFIDTIFLIWHFYTHFDKHNDKILLYQQWKQIRKLLIIGIIGWGILLLIYMIYVGEYITLRIIMILLYSVWICIFCYIETKWILIKLDKQRRQSAFSNNDKVNINDIDGTINGDNLSIPMPNMEMIHHVVDNENDKKIIHDMLVDTLDTSHYDQEWNKLKPNNTKHKKSKSNKFKSKSKSKYKSKYKSRSNSNSNYNSNSNSPLQQSPKLRVSSKSKVKLSLIIENRKKELEQVTAGGYGEDMLRIHKISSHSTEQKQQQQQQQHGDRLNIITHPPEMSPISDSEDLYRYNNNNNYNNYSYNQNQHHSIITKQTPNGSNSPQLQPGRINRKFKPPPVSIHHHPNMLNVLDHKGTMSPMSDSEDMYHNSPIVNMVQTIRTPNPNINDIDINKSPVISPTPREEKQGNAIIANMVMDVHENHLHIIRKQDDKKIEELQYENDNDMNLQSILPEMPVINGIKKTPQADDWSDDSDHIIYGNTTTRSSRQTLSAPKDKNNNANHQQEGSLSMNEESKENDNRPLSSLPSKVKNGDNDSNDDNDAHNKDDWNSSDSDIYEDKLNDNDNDNISELEEHLKNLRDKEKEYRRHYKNMSTTATLTEEYEHTVEGHSGPEEFEMEDDVDV